VKCVNFSPQSFKSVGRFGNGDYFDRRLHCLLRDQNPIDSNFGIESRLDHLQQEVREVYLIYSEWYKYFSLSIKPIVLSRGPEPVFQMGECQRDLLMIGGKERRLLAAKKEDILHEKSEKERKFTWVTSLLSTTKNTFLWLYLILFAFQIPKSGGDFALPPFRGRLLQRPTLRLRRRRLQGHNSQKVNDKT